jgi:hypothetical protein
MNTANGARRWNASLLTVQSPPHRHTNSVVPSAALRRLQLTAKQQSDTSRSQLPAPLQLPMDPASSTAAILSPRLSTVPVECSLKEASVLLYQNWHGEVDETPSFEFFR